MLRFTIDYNLDQAISKVSDKAGAANNILLLPLGGPLTKDMDGFSAGQLSKAVIATQFKAERSQFLEIIAPNLSQTRHQFQAIVLYGTAAKEKDKSNKRTEGADKSEEQQWLELGGTIQDKISDFARRLQGDDKSKKTNLCWVIDKTAVNAEQLAALLLGYRLKEWQFHPYLTDAKKKNPSPFAHELVIVEGGMGDQAQLANLTKQQEAIYNGVIFTRQLVSEPANILNPKTFANRCKALSEDGVKVTILDEAEMEKQGMGALLAVGRGSTQESQLAVLSWQGGEKTQAPICFVGKGVCFDSGGISLKPSGGMEEMIWDMGGAGAVAGLMKCLAQRKAAVNVVAVLALVENMPDGNAQRPGDIVTSMSGQTIEVLNTDAEGRLILADALWYAQEHFKPSTIIDLATLTGAMIVALGHDRAGLFSNDDKLSNELYQAGQSVDEKLWAMPLSPLGGYYDKLIDCFAHRADVKNIGAPGQAGSITAAQFLQRFIKTSNDYQPAWAHLDIAGVAWQKSNGPLYRMGASGYGVRLLNEWVSKQFG